ncbi:MAG: hypothetical protein JXA90_11390, partial [Planctomycetes bacterium]|nr:hypothetical protein [Planctomycetota bacterium]
MKNAYRWLSVGAVFALAVNLGAQPVEETFCESPATNCVDDVIQVRFVDSDSTVLPMPAIGTQVEVRIGIDTVSGNDVVEDNEG